MEISAEVGGYKISAPVSKEFEKSINWISNIVKVAREKTASVARTLGATEEALKGGIVIKPEVVVKEAKVEVPFLTFLKQNMQWVVIFVGLVLIILILVFKK